MVIDSSALVAILEYEPEREIFLELIEVADARRLSMANFVEVSILAESRRGLLGAADIDRLIRSMRIELINVDLEQAHAPAQRSRALEREDIALD